MLTPSCKALPLSSFLPPSYLTQNLYSSVLHEPILTRDLSLSSPRLPLSLLNPSLSLSPSPFLSHSDSAPPFFSLSLASHGSRDKGALLEEVLADGIRRSQRGGRARDVWMVMEPVFLDHPSLASLRAAIRPPTAAIVSTNGDWMLTIVHEMLPQATIGKFYAPTPQLPDPLKSKLTPGDVALGGGGIWH
ncbi:unnamed protein product [Closterium sp. NIES-53]